MNSEFEDAFAALRGMLQTIAKKLAVTADSDKEYTLHTKKPSPFPQQKGGPLYFCGVKMGKAYVSLHVFPLYLEPKLKDGMSAELKKRMQGMTCFNFKAKPDAAVLKELKALTAAGLADFSKRGWL
jgi:hypothetical protein